MRYRFAAGRNRAQPSEARKFLPAIRIMTFRAHSAPRALARCPKNCKTWAVAGCICRNIRRKAPANDRNASGSDPVAHVERKRPAPYAEHRRQARKSSDHSREWTVPFEADAGFSRKSAGFPPGVSSVVEVWSCTFHNYAAKSLMLGAVAIRAWRRGACRWASRNISSQLCHALPSHLGTKRQSDGRETAGATCPPSVIKRKSP